MWKPFNIKNSMLTIFNINNVSGVVLLSLFLTVNISQTYSNCCLWTGKCLHYSYWKGKHFWRQDRTYHALCIILSVNKIYWQIAFELIPSQPYGRISEKFLRRSLLQTLILVKKMQLTFKMTCCMHICLFIDFACYKTN